MPLNSTVATVLLGAELYYRLLRPCYDNNMVLELGKTPKLYHRTPAQFLDDVLIENIDDPPDVM